MGLMLVLAGVAEVIVALGAYTIPVIRGAEELIPDHAQTHEDEPSGAQGAVAPAQT